MVVIKYNYTHLFTRLVVEGSNLKSIGKLRNLATLNTKYR